MLKSLLREIIGISTVVSERAESLSPFRGRYRVLVLFEGATDERPEVQERYLANRHDILTANDIVLLRVAGGGVFSSFDNPLEISADDLRAELNGPSPEEFEAVLVDRDGAIIYRSPAPVEVFSLLETIRSLPALA
jgi:hypothetical protein